MDFENKIICGDWIEVLKGLPDAVAHVVITSPPYWGQRNYGVEGQLGLEKTPEEHIEKLAEGFREVWRILRPDGVVWLNYGDKYNAGRSGGHPGGKFSGFQQVDDRYQNQSGVNVRSLKPGDLLGLPWRIALALQADGWWLRCDIVWVKAWSFHDCGQKKFPGTDLFGDPFVDVVGEQYSGSTMPESVNGWRWERHRVKIKSLRPGNNRGQRVESGDCPSNVGNKPTAIWQDCPGCPKCIPNDGLVLRKGSWRPTRAHEFLFQLAKSPEYFCDPEAVREPHAEPWRSGDKEKPVSPTVEEQAMGVHKWLPAQRNYNPSGRNLRDCWCINPMPYKFSEENFHLARVQGDELSDDMKYIVSPNCPMHGGLFDLVAIPLCGERAGDWLTHIRHSDARPAPLPISDSVLFGPLHIYYYDGHNLDYWLREHAHVAIDHNNQSRKMAHVLVTNPSSKPSAQRLSRIVHRLVLRGLSERARNIFENNTWPDEMDAHLLDEMIFRNIGKSSYQNLQNNNCQCILYNVVSQTASHYATFPEKLVEPCIKVSTSEKGCCPKCGSQWARIVDKRGETPREKQEHRGYSNYSKSQPNGNSQGLDYAGGHTTNIRNTTTLGWKATCKCGIEETKPCIVFDPFAGSGTTCAVAARLNRNYIAIELNEDYVKKQAEIRIASAETGLTTKELSAGQGSLWKGE